MAEKQSNQSNQSQPQPLDTLAQITRAQLERTEAWAAELAQMESAAYDRAKEMIGYSADLAAEWRRLVLESARKTVDMLSSRA